MFQFTIPAWVLAFALTAATAAAADGEIPKKYVGSWRGLMAEMSGSSVSKPRTLVTVTKEIGHRATYFNFEVAPDGAISGSGRAMFQYKSVVIENRVLATVTSTLDLDPQTATLDFDIRGKVAADGTVKITGEPKGRATSVTTGQDGRKIREQRDTWDVFIAANDVKITEDGWKMTMGYSQPNPAAKIEWKADNQPELCKEVAAVRQLRESYDMTKKLYEAARGNLNQYRDFNEVQDRVTRGMEAWGKDKGLPVGVSGSAGDTIRYKDGYTDATGRYLDPSGYPNVKAGDPDPRRSWDVDIPFEVKESRYPFITEITRLHEQGHADTMKNMFQKFKDGKIDWSTWEQYSSFGLKGEAMKVYVDDEIKHYTDLLKKMQEFIDKYGKDCPAAGGTPPTGAPAGGDR